MTDKNKQKKLKEFDQFDAWWCSILPYKDVWPEARKYANEMADTLECEGPEHRVFREKTVQHVDWVED